MFGDKPGTNWFHILINDPVAMACLFWLSLIPTLGLGWAVGVDRWIESQGVNGIARLTWHQRHFDVHEHNESYMVDYEFSPPESLSTLRPYWPYRALQVRVPKADYNQATAVKQVAVKYLPDYPEYNRPVRCTTSAGLVALLAFSTIVNVMLGGGVALAVHLRRERRKMRHSYQAVGAAA